MRDTTRRHQVDTSVSEIGLAAYHLREADACLQQVTLTANDRAILLSQCRQATRMLSRIDLWLTLGEPDLDEELRRLIQDDLRLPEIQINQREGEK